MRSFIGHIYHHHTVSVLGRAKHPIISINTPSSYTSAGGCSVQAPDHIGPEDFCTRRAAGATAPNFIPDPCAWLSSQFCTDLVACLRLTSLVTPYHGEITPKSSLQAR